jgi:hypothetical protein
VTGQVINVEERDSTEPTPSGQTLYFSTGEGRRFIVDIAHLTRVEVQRNSGYCDIRNFQNSTSLTLRASVVLPDRSIVESTVGRCL